MDFFSFINFYIIPGIILGSIYASGAIGVTLIFSILRFAHLAHGDMATFSAFVALFVVSTLTPPIWLALIVCIVATALLAYFIDAVFYDFLRKKPAIITVMSSLGIALMIRSFVQVVWGTDPQVYKSGISLPTNYYGFLIQTREIWTFISNIVAMSALMLFLKFSKWGKAMRATSNNSDLALLCGIDSTMVIKLTWIIVGVMVALSGFFLGLNTEVKSMMGWSILLPVFAAAILGGVGRIEGAIVGGLIIGIVEELSVFLLSSNYKSATAFAILILVLIFRPTGIFKGKVL